MTSDEICLRVQSGELKLAWGILSSSCSRLNLDPCKSHDNVIKVMKEIEKKKDGQQK